MAGLLGAIGYMAAGGAMQHADASNARTEALNRVEMALISAEAEDWYAQRREERAGLAEAAKHERDIGRKDYEYSRDRTAKLEDTEATQSHDLRKLEVKHGYDKDLEGAKQAAEERRTRISQEGANNRAKLRAEGLLNTGARGGSSGKDITKSVEADRKRIFDLRKELIEPMNARSAEKSQLLKQEIARLEDSVAQRIHGDSPLNLDALQQ